LIIAHQRIDSFFSIRDQSVSYAAITEAQIDGIEADILKFHDELIGCCERLSERIQDSYKGFTIRYSDLQTDGIWLQISLKSPDNVNATVYSIDELRKQGDIFCLSDFTKEFREKFLLEPSSNNNNNSASSSNRIIGKKLTMIQQQ
jgi:hypothetical protein